MEEKKYNLILNIGPPRTGTTYLFDMLYNSPQHIKDNIAPQSPWKMLDKHYDRYKKGRIDNTQFTRFKMRFKESDTYTSNFHLSMFLDCPERLSEYVDSFAVAGISSKYIYVNSPNILVSNVDTETGFRDLQGITCTVQNIQAIDKKIDNIFKLKNELFTNFFKKASPVFENIHIISGYRWKNRIDSLVGMIEYYFDGTHLNNYSYTDLFELEKFSDIIPYIKIYDLLQHLIENTEHIDNIHHTILDFEYLNDSKYLYKKLKWLFDSQEQIQNNPAFGKKSFASKISQENRQYKLPKFLYDYYLPHLEQQKIFFDKYIHAD